MLNAQRTASETSENSQWSSFCMRMHFHCMLMQFQQDLLASKNQSETPSAAYRPDAA